MAWLASGDAAFREPAAKAAQYVAGGILDTGVDKPRGANDPMYGGAGYGLRKPGEPPYADMSNTSYALEALMRARDAGLAFDQEAFTAATKFLERSQHRTESNDQPWASDLPKLSGGFIYHPNESKAEMVEIGGKKFFMPYGTMTYAGIKSFIYARVDRDDPRVKAATNWIRQFFTLEENPGFDTTRDLNLGKQGLYYYFDTFAKAHHALGEEQFADANGVAHRWREELAAEVCSRQKPDGSWVNEVDRWMEALPTLATSYALMALSYSLPAPR
jgi:squalene-hopene/tetraprenyl-beta-curcumene cyclase